MLCISFLCILSILLLMQDLTLLMQQITMLGKLRRKVLVRSQISRSVVD